MSPIYTGSLLLSLALFAGNVVAECERNEYGIFEDIGCASEAFSTADRELNSVYAQLLNSLDAADRKVLLQSQRSWLAFVEANSRFIYVIEGDGSQGRLVVVNAREKYTRLRVNELKGWMPR